MWWIVAGIAVVGAAALGPVMSDVEQAKYVVVESHDSIEVRDYAPMIAAEVVISGERAPAIQQGFRMIADYIFGNNISAQNVAEKVAMSAPVIQQPSAQTNETIAMTAPVIQQGDGARWSVRFVMPAGYTLATLPKPKNDAVKLTEIEAKRFATIRFSGLAGDESLKEHTAELEQFIKEHPFKAISAPAYAFFNPPWTLPFLRRNEVMIEVAK